MRPLLASELLTVWEEGQGAPPCQQAILLLVAACPDETPEDILALSIGSRDGRLLTLREWAFGSKLMGLGVCPACRESLEFTFDVSDVRVPEPEREKRTFHLDVEDFSVDFRLLNTKDLFETARGHEGEQIERALIERCVDSVRRRDQTLTAQRLPPNLVEALAKELAAADPQADTQLALSCPSCGHGWLALFDVVSFFWSEINAWAGRVLREVHLLASAYGWREEDILKMSPLRRNLYLDLVGV